MGLDMYLYAEKYVSGYNFEKNEAKEQYVKLLEVAGFNNPPCEHTPGGYIKLCAMYWRKANAIHNWFVQEVQDGKDDCGSYYVSRQNLIELRDACEASIKHVTSFPMKTIAVHVGWSNGEDMYENIEVYDVDEPPELETIRGFFFGGTEYSEWYVEKLQDTIDGINETL